MTDMDGDRVIALVEVFIAPNLMEKLLRTHYASLFPAQDRQDGEFRGCQGKRFLIQGAFMGSGIQHQARMGD